MQGDARWSSCSGGQTALTRTLPRAARSRGPVVIGTSCFVRCTTDDAFDLGRAEQRCIDVGLDGELRSAPMSAVGVMTTFAPQSLIRSLSDSALSPLKTTLWALRCARTRASR